MVTFGLVISVSSNESVYIIDFESAGGDGEMCLEDERREVEKLFEKIRKEREQGQEVST